MAAAESKPMDPLTFDRVWRGSGIAFVVTFIVSYVIYGTQPKIGASANTLVSFYSGDRTRILIASALLGLSILNLLWFAAALASTLRDAGQGIWGAAATAASTALATILFVRISVGAALAYSIAGAKNETLVSGLNALAQVCIVVAAFSAAMLVMAGTFGLRQARVISSGAFSAGVAAVVLVLLGGTTWANDGFWAPDGAYSRVIWPIVALVWIATASGVLYTRSPSAPPVAAPAATPGFRARDVTA
ncbi:MAG: hypothetical protein E6J50_06455 [Chloroflexi bacterium]|nr:MAG: hypothetical protein E6J50_06455 [Chloroflexota bacterium]